MKMTLEQTQIVGLTMKLDLKAREFNQLCKRLEKLKEQNLDKNSEEFKQLLNEFKKNQAEIKQINQKLTELNKNNKDYNLQDKDA